MPQPDSTRHRPHLGNPAAPWPVDPASPQRGSRAGARPGSRPKEAPKQDTRTPDDRDGNEELEREKGGGGDTQARAREGHERDFAEDEDTEQWVASERFTVEDELDDTLPNVPRYQEH